MNSIAIHSLQIIWVCKFWVIDVSTKPKAKMYAELNTFILWFYVLTTLAIKTFLNLTHVSSKLQALIYILLKSFCILLASFTLIYWHVSYFSNMKLLLPEFCGMSKFIVMNTVKFFLISMTVFIRLKGINHGEHHLLTEEVFYFSLVFFLMSIIIGIQYLKIKRIES